MFKNIKINCTSPQPCPLLAPGCLLAEQRAVVGRVAVWGQCCGSSTETAREASVFAPSVLPHLLCAACWLSQEPHLGRGLWSDGAKASIPTPPPIFPKGHILPSVEHPCHATASQDTRRDMVTHSGSLGWAWEKVCSDSRKLGI